MIAGLALILGLCLGVLLRFGLRAIRLSFLTLIGVYMLRLCGSH